MKSGSVYLPNFRPVPKSVHFTFSLFLNKCLFYVSQSYVSERSWVGVCFLIGSLLANTKILASKSQTFTHHFLLKPKAVRQTEAKILLNIIK